MNIMSEKDLIDQINNADIPEELENAIIDLMQEAEPMLPKLSMPDKYRIPVMLDILVKEVIDASVDTHWWKVLLEFVTEAAQKQCENFQPVVAAVERLRPLLMQHLGPYDEVSLREITKETVRGICLLSETLTPPKKFFVASNAVSLAQAHFNKHAWFRAIYAGKAAVGFIMLDDNEEEQEYYLWRFMIAEPFHGRGYGRKAIEKLVDYVKTRPGAKELLVSCAQGEGSPEDFYVKLGFSHTGEMEGFEVGLRRVL